MRYHDLAVGSLLQSALPATYIELAKIAECLDHPAFYDELLRLESAGLVKRVGDLFCLARPVVPADYPRYEHANFWSCG